MRLISEAQLGGDLRRGLPQPQQPCRLVYPIDLTDALESDAGDGSEVALNRAFVKPLSNTAQRSRHDAVLF